MQASAPVSRALWGCYRGGICLPLPPQLAAGRLTTLRPRSSDLKGVKTAAVIAAPMIGRAARLAVRALFPAKLLPQLVRSTPALARVAPALLLVVVAYSVAVTYFAYLHQQQRQQHESIRKKAPSISTEGAAAATVAAAAAAARARLDAEDGLQRCRVCGGSGYVELEYKMKYEGMLCPCCLGKGRAKRTDNIVSALLSFNLPGPQLPPPVDADSATPANQAS